MSAQVPEDYNIVVYKYISKGRQYYTSIILLEYTMNIIH